MTAQGRPAGSVASPGVVSAPGLSPVAIPRVNKSSSKGRCGLPTCLPGTPIIFVVPFPLTASAALQFPWPLLTVLRTLLSRLWLLVICQWV